MHNSRYYLVPCCLLALLPLFALADSFSIAKKASPTVSKQIQNLSLVCGSVELSQSQSQSISNHNSASCNSGDPGYFHNNISYFRAFSLGAYPQGFSACAVRVGIESANAGGTGTSQPLTVRLYANTGAAFPDGNRVEIAATTIGVTDLVQSVIDIPLLGSFAPGAELVAEVFTPKGLSAGHSLFIGSNAVGESAPGYVTAPACGLNAPTPLAAIGSPNMHLVLTVLGSGSSAAQNLVISPSSVNFGARLVGSTTTHEVSVKNDGSTTLILTDFSTGTAPFARMDGSCSAVPLALAPGALCTMQYSFKPLSANEFEQHVTVNSSVGSLQLTLAGEGSFFYVTVPSLSFYGTLLLTFFVIGIGAVVLRQTQAS